MIQEEPTGAGEPISLREVGWELCPANMLEHAHAHNLIEDGSLWQVPVVLDLYLAAIRKPGLGDALAGQGCLGLAQRDAGCPYAVALGSIQNQVAPPTAYVKQALTRL